jgi:hypothetical protein
MTPGRVARKTVASGNEDRSSGSVGTLKTRELDQQSDVRRGETDHVVGMLLLDSVLGRRSSTVGITDLVANGPCRFKNGSVDWREELVVFALCKESDYVRLNRAGLLG